MRLGPQMAFRLLREWQGSGFIEDKAEQGSGQTQPLVAHHATGLSTMSYAILQNQDVVNVLYSLSRFAPNDYSGRRINELNNS